MSISLGDAILTLGADGRPLEAAIRKASGEVTTGLGGAANKAKLIFAGMSAAIVGSITAIGVGIFKSASDFDSASKKMSASLGLPIEEAKRLKEIIKKVYADNFGSIEEVGEIATQVALSLKTIGVTSSDSIIQVTEGVKTLKDAFGVDYASSIDAVNALMSEFGLTGEQAMDFISSGFQKGLNASDDFLDSIREYANQFHEGGGDASQFFSLLETGLANGVLGTDKAADMFKEFRVRILDGSKSTSDALEQIGIDSESFIAKLSSGQMTVAEAFTIVQEGLRQVGDQSTLMQAGVGLLGTQFEDLGAKAALNIDLSKTKIESLKGATNNLQDQYKTIGAALQGIWKQVEVAFEPAGAAMIAALQERMPQIQAFMKELTALAPKIGELFGQVLDALLNTFIPLLAKILELMAQHPYITAFVLAFATLAPVLIPLLTLLTTIGGAIAGIGTASVGAVGVAGGAGVLGLNAGLLLIIANAIPFIAALTAITWAIVKIGGETLNVIEANKQLKQSQDSLNKKWDEYIAKLKAKGVALDEDKMKSMDHMQRVVYTHAMETQVSDNLTKAYIANIQGRNASEEEFARAKNLLMNENLTREEAATLATMQLSDGMYQNLLRGSKESTEADLYLLGLREKGYQDKFRAITDLSTDAAKKQIEDANKASEDSIKAQVEAAKATETEWTGAIGAIKEIWQSLINLFTSTGRVAANIASWLMGGQPAYTGDNASGIPGNAQGVRNFEGGLSWVGEHGAELVRLPPGSDVYSHTESVNLMKGATSSNVNNINVNVDLSGSQLDANAVGRIVAQQISTTLSRQGAF